MQINSQGLFRSSLWQKEFERTLAISGENGHEAGFLTWCTDKAVHVNRAVEGEEHSMNLHIQKQSEYAQGEGLYEGEGGQGLVLMHTHPTTEGRSPSQTVFASYADLSTIFALAVENYVIADMFGLDHWFNPVMVVASEEVGKVAMYQHGMEFLTKDDVDRLDAFYRHTRDVLDELFGLYYPGRKLKYPWEVDLILWMMRAGVDPIPPHVCQWKSRYETLMRKLHVAYHEMSVEDVRNGNVPKLKLRHRFSWA